MTLAALHHQIQTALSAQRFVSSHPLIVQLIQSSATEPYYQAEGYFFLGVVNSEIGQFNKATQCLEKAVALSKNPEYFAYMAKCYALLGDTNQAMRAVDAIDIGTLAQPNALDTIGVALSRIGFHERALAFFEKAISLNDQHPQYFYNYGMSLKFAGQFSLAKQAYERVLALLPTHAPTHFALADLGGATAEQNNIPRLEALLAQEDIPVDDIMHLAHALALELQSIGQHEEAFITLGKAKARKAASIDYTIKEDQALFAAIQTLGQTIQPNTNKGCESERPIFVVGMPRSGTTLVERILSHHSQVGSGGELQDFGIAVKELTQTPGQRVLDIPTMQAAQQLDMHLLGQTYIEKTQRIAPDNIRFIDKLPFNFFYVDLIKQALPKAKVIVMLRDPMDTCVGNYRQLFSLNSPYYNYAFNLGTVGHFYVAFRKHITALQARWEDGIYIQDYQALVQSPEQQVRALLDFCDLPFEAQCLAVEKNTLPVSTASKVQVRQPINTSSIGRWKKFGTATDPLHKILSAHRLV
ncbi:MAG: sulfotransferase [Glaciecola sp.]|jgi:Flp pilus assembly protein TadD